MLRKAILAAIICSLSISQSAFAEDKRSLWDMSKLASLSSGQTRAIFGYSPATSISDNYSFSQDGLISRGNQNWSFKSVLMPCSAFKEIDRNYTACIEKVSSRKIGTTTWTNGVLSNSQLGESNAILKGGIVPGKIIYDGTVRPDGIRTDGDRATIWTLKDANHQGGSNYLVRANYVGGAAPNGNRLSLEIFPISMGSNEKVLNEDSITIGEFPSDVEYQVKLRLGVFIKTLTGWFFGRLTSPVIDRNGPEGYLEVAGLPARVPVGITQPLIASEVKNYLDPTWCTELGYEWDKNCGPTQAIIGVPYTAGQAPPGLLEQLEKAPGGVTTISTLSYWKIETSYFYTTAQNPSESQKCVSELYGVNARVFQGAVLSNASLFQTSSPTWNEINQSFTFKLASPHLDEINKPNIGFYTLYLPLELAKCRWGSAVTNAKAEVQIVNSAGISTVTTIAATIENGMLRFNISGFGYSSPTIVIRMKSEVSQVRSEPVVVKGKSTITCIKGKLTKKVTGLAPKCPAGYKKK